jgi:hypothetical protein
MIYKCGGSLHRHHIDEQPIETVDAALAGDQAPGGDQFLEIFGVDQRLGAGVAKLACSQEGRGRRRSKRRWRCPDGRRSRNRSS